MKKIFDIAIKDLKQTLHSPMAALFLLVLPIIFTAFFGVIFNSTAADAQEIEAVSLQVVRSPQENSLQDRVIKALNDSETLNIEVLEAETLPNLTEAFEGDAIAGLLYMPVGFDLDNADFESSILYVDENTSSGVSLRYQVQQVLSETISKQYAVNTAIQAVDGQVPYGSAHELEEAQVSLLEVADAAWGDRAISVETEKAVAQSTDISELGNAYDQSSPGMLVQFTISGLMGTAVILVQERKTKTLERMLTTATSEAQILIGHVLSMYTIIVAQQIILVLVGNFLFQVDYLREPLAIFLVILSLAAWVTGLGIFIGTLAKNEDQVILFSLIAMFVFTALGGAWFPLEGTSAAFYNIAKFTPAAFAMEGFQNIIVRKLDLSSVWGPVLALCLYAALFYISAIWIFKKRR